MMVSAKFAFHSLIVILLDQFTSTLAKPTVTETRSLSEIYSRAKLETGTLQVAWGGDEPSGGNGILSAFNKNFPDVKINVTVDLSKYHDSRTDRSFESEKRDKWDVALLQTLHDFPRWKNERRLLNYKPANWDAIHPALRDSDGAYAGYFVYSFGNLVYNTAKISDSQVPKSYAEFVEPQWKNKLVLTYPNDDDAIAFLFATIIEKLGWSWFERLATQGVKWVRGSATPAALISKSDSNLAISFTSFPLYPNLKLLPPSSSSVKPMTWAQTGAIFSSTRMPESAKLFLNYLLSNEWQNQIVTSGIQPTRTNIPNPAAQSPFSNGNNPLAFRQWMMDRAKVERMKLQLETTLGTAQGLSPLEDGI